MFTIFLCGVCCSWTIACDENPPVAMASTTDIPITLSDYAVHSVDSGGAVYRLTLQNMLDGKINFKRFIIRIQSPPGIITANSECTLLLQYTPPQSATPTPGAAAAATGTAAAGAPPTPTAAAPAVVNTGTGVPPPPPKLQHFYLFDVGNPDVSVANGGMCRIKFNPSVIKTFVKKVITLTPGNGSPQFNFRVTATLNVSGTNITRKFYLTFIVSGGKLSKSMSIGSAAGLLPPGPDAGAGGGGSDSKFGGNGGGGGGGGGGPKSGGGDDSDIACEPPPMTVEYHTYFFPSESRNGAALCVLAFH